MGVLRDIPSLAHQREITPHPIVLRRMAEGGRNTRLPSGYAENFVNAVDGRFTVFNMSFAAQGACSDEMRSQVLQRMSRGTF